MNKGYHEAMYKSRLNQYLVSVTNASKVIVPANDHRLALQIFLCGAASIYITLDDPAVAGNGWFITNTVPPPQWCLLTHGDLVRKRFSCITTAATINLLVCEELLDPD